MKKKVGPTPPNEKKECKLAQAELALLDRQAWHLYCDFIIISDLAEHLDHKVGFFCFKKQIMFMLLNLKKSFLKNNSSLDKVFELYGQQIK